MWKTRWIKWITRQAYPIFQAFSAFGRWKNRWIKWKTPKITRFARRFMSTCNIHFAYTLPGTGTFWLRVSPRERRVKSGAYFVDRQYRGGGFFPPPYFFLQWLLTTPILRDVMYYTKGGIAWTVIISLWAVFASLAAAAAASVPVYVVFIAGGSSASAFAMLSAGIVCAGLAISMFFGSKEASTGIVALIRRITVWIKNRFIKKEAA